METQVPCFKGKTAKAMIELLDGFFTNGLDGNEESTVPDPHNDIRGHAVDGACVFAYTVRYLLNQDFTMYEIEQHTEEVYAEFIRYIKTEIDFQGVSGKVKFETNDKPAYLAVQQVQEGSKVTVGTCSHNVTMDLTINGGPSNASWTPPHPDVIPYEEPFPYILFQIGLPILCICCPGLAACIRNF
jgi:hypothetical protein